MRDRLFKDDHVRPIDHFIDYFGTKDRDEPSSAPAWLEHLLDNLDTGSERTP